MNRYTKFGLLMLAGGGIFLAGWFKFVPVKDFTTNRLLAKTSWTLEQDARAIEKNKNLSLDQQIDKVQEAQGVFEDRKERIQNGKSAQKICGASHATDPKDGSPLTIIGASCNPGETIKGVYHPGFVPWIYDGPEVIADVRILTADGIPLDVVPELTTEFSRGSTVKSLGGFRFRLSGEVSYIQKIKLSGGQIVKVTPVKK